MSMDSLTHTSLKQCVIYKGADMDREIYDPFYPTEGMKGDDGKYEKYDPFDPTGSPASDGKGGKVGVVNKNIEQGDDELEEPPDSTVAMIGLSSPCQITAVAWRQRVDSNSTKAQEKTDSDESDHSEIEEGEIIGGVDKNGSAKRFGKDISSLSSTRVSFLGSKPERILRVLDGDGFVSVCTEANWKTEIHTEDEPAVEVEDLRSKLVSRRKERYLSYPPSSSHSPQAPMSPSNPLTVTAPTHFTSHVEQSSKKYKLSKSLMDTDRLKSKNKNPGEKEERKKKKKDEGVRERCKDKDKEQREAKRSRKSRSSSSKARKRHHGSLELSRSWKSDKKDSTGNFLSLSEEEKREAAWNMDRGNEKDKDRHRGRDKHRGRERDWERGRSHTSSRGRVQRDKDSSYQKKNKEIKGRCHVSTREHGKSKCSKRSREKREISKDAQRDKEWRRDGRPVVPPSIQDLNGSDLFAIKRTITVTTTTTTTTVPGSPRLASVSPCLPIENSTKPPQKKKRKRQAIGEVDDCHSQSQSLSPLRYQSYESDHYSDKLEIDVLSLDGEALDSDYPSLEDSPPPVLPPEPPVPSPKTKTNLKTEQHHVKKKLQTLKKKGQSESSSPSRSKSKCISSLLVTSGSVPVSSGFGLAKRARKIVKEKEKGSRKNVVRSSKLKKDGGRKSKLQSKVSVLVREGVSSTTGPSVGSGKMGIELLGPGGTSGGSGSSVVGGSIAVVFCRDNESRSPFLKPCSEPLSLSSRSKDLDNMEKRNRLGAPSSLTSSVRLKPKKTKQSSITSTSSLASSPSSSLVNKGRRSTGKKIKENSEATGSTAGDVNQIKSSMEIWSGASLDVQSAAGERRKSVSPQMSQAGPALCSSSASCSSAISVLPPSSSPPHTPPSPMQDTRESTPDSQTVDSSCKTPDPLFLGEECLSQSSPILLPASGPPSISISHGSGLNITLSTPTAKSLPPDNASKSLISLPCLSSSAGCGLSSLSLPLSSSDPSSSSVSSSSASKPPHPLPLSSPALPWSLQTGVDCTTGGVLAYPLTGQSKPVSAPSTCLFSIHITSFTPSYTSSSSWSKPSSVYPPQFPSVGWLHKNTTLAPAHFYRGGLCTDPTLHYTCGIVWSVWEFG
ncbi:splicing factor, arginine/serine-rich 19 isoform X2 [Takifugu flavidus]|uniref:splicing factor, arginine/serine-rich 19 isoform X2 n=1 Tax=Takifugu flavidus TaxID=433684 RepID=UPI0025445188|nr:splicing factor, arginine/serine-rich 19 isoform X2 [Takifugu flavidus]